MTARQLALALGITYAVLTVLELIVGGWAVGSSAVILRTTKMNLLHWAVALSLLGGRAAGEEPVRIVTWIVGSVLAILGLGGLFAAEALGRAFGADVGIPVAYSAFHLVTGVLTLSGEFLRRRRTA